MTFKVTIKNIGKLTDAEIRIGRFTVFAGPNNTGKSFVSKLLYSLFDAMNPVLVREYLLGLSKLVGKQEFDLFNASDLSEYEKMRQKMDTGIRAGSDSLNTWVGELKKSSVRLIEQMEPGPLLSSLTENVRNLEVLARSWKSGNPSEAYEIISKLISNLGEIQHTVDEIRSERIKTELGPFEKSLADLQEECLGWASLSVATGIQYRIRQNLCQNFQAPRLSDLMGEENIPSEINVGDFGRFEFLNRKVEFEISSVWLRHLKCYSNIIYLESPVYWKLKSALEDVYDLHGNIRNRIEGFSKHEIAEFRPEYLELNRERLSGVPGYFHDLVKALRFEYTGDMAFPDVYEKLTGEDVIGGKITISEIGNLSFQEHKRSFSIPATATGVANLGILALLIERKVLDENALIFIDEPEAHLHPAWQVVMAEALFELSRQGANVVIATHSADILKWLEVHAKKNPEDKDLIALNRFPVNSSEVDEDFETKMANIKQELTKPFSDLYLEGI